MRKIMHFIFYILILNPCILWADPLKLFRGCESVGVEFENKVLSLKSNVSPSKQTLYFIHNKTNAPVNLATNIDHNNPHLSYPNQIAAKSWGVFAMDEPSITFMCQTAENKTIQCKNTVEICQYVNLKFPQSHNGNYWAVRSMPLMPARKEIIHQGILLRW